MGLTCINFECILFKSSKCEIFSSKCKKSHISKSVKTYETKVKLKQHETNAISENLECSIYMSFRCITLLQKCLFRTCFLILKRKQLQEFSTCHIDTFRCILNFLKLYCVSQYHVFEMYHLLQIKVIRTFQLFFSFVAGLPM